MDNKNIKKAIVYLITIAIVLSYISIFFCNYIIDIGPLSDREIVEMIMPDDKDFDKNVGDKDHSNNNGNNGNSDGSGANNNGINDGNNMNSNGNNGNNNGTNSNVNNGSNTGNNANNGGNNNNGSNNNNNGNSGDNGNSGNNGNYDIENPPSEYEDVNYTDKFKVLQNGTSWKELKEIDMFKNEYFRNQSIIAPGVSGSYNFSVENQSPVKFEYAISFNEENIYNVNMLYKLKRNGTYIEGDSSNWVSYTQLSQSKILLNENSLDVYTVEWKWIDTDYDTQIGQTYGANYKMFVQVTAAQMTE